MRAVYIVARVPRVARATVSRPFWVHACAGHFARRTRACVCGVLAPDSLAAPDAQWRARYLERLNIQGCPAAAAHSVMHSSAAAGAAAAGAAGAAIGGDATPSPAAAAAAMGECISEWATAGGGARRPAPPPVSPAGVSNFHFPNAGVARAMVGTATSPGTVKAPTGDGGTHIPMGARTPRSPSGGAARSGGGFGGGMHIPMGGAGGGGGGALTRPSASRPIRIALPVVGRSTGEGGMHNRMGGGGGGGTDPGVPLISPVTPCKGVRRRATVGDSSRVSGGGGMHIPMGGGGGGVGVRGGAGGAGPRARRVSRDDDWMGALSGARRGAGGGGSCPVLCVRVCAQRRLQHAFVCSVHGVTDDRVLNLIQLCG